MDFEPSMRAKALLLYGTHEATDIFVKKYPKVVKNYQRILENMGIDFNPLIGNKDNRPKETLKSTKQELENQAKVYIDKFSRRLDAFITDEALASIGITIPLDTWQKYNRTEIALNLNKLAFQYPDREEKLNDVEAVEITKNTLRFDFSKDKNNYYYQLMSQQILNPKFIKYLVNIAKKEGNTSEIDHLRKIQGTLNSYQNIVNNVRTEIYNTVINENLFEFDSQFQTLACAVTTKMLSTIGGEFNPQDQNSLYWNLYRTITNRELSLTLVLLKESGFAPDVLIDPVYAIEPNLRFLDQFHDLLLNRGILKKPANQDVLAMDKAIQEISRGIFSSYEDRRLTPEEKVFLQREAQYHVMEIGYEGVNRAHQVLSAFY
jgi:hypothetical protein